MIDMSLLFNYGILGLWTASLLYEKFTVSKELRLTLANNTLAIEDNTLILKLLKQKIR